jgi:phosphoribosylformylglycinamidine cyclo-ligase
LTGSGARAGEDAYRAAGVDVDANARAVSLLSEVVRAASRPEVRGGLRGFAGLFDLGDGRLLSAATDGVGTKLEVARLLGRFDTVGIDLVAMSANDVICTGAEPLFFLDYLTVGRLEPSRVAALVEGVAEGCRRAGCALLGGETAEHPGVMEEDEFDLGGFCVGIVRSEDVLRPESVEVGDILVGLRSSGLHSNGFSLVRRVLLGDADDPSEMVKILDQFEPSLGRTLGEELLEPTTIYVRPLLAMAREGLVRSAAHITGGGWFENLPRALHEGLGADVDTQAWEPQPIFEMVGAAAGLDQHDLFEVFNMGIGMVVVTPADAVDRTIGTAQSAGAEALVVGRVSSDRGIRLT